MIRKSTAADIPRVMEIFESARKALRDSGVDQWQNGYPDEACVRMDVEEGIGYVLEADGAVVATAAVFVGHDATYDVIEDGAWLTENNAYGVIHRVAVDPAFKGRGIAAGFVVFCVELCRARGVSSLRCDTHRDNKAMQRALEKNGYRPCGTIYVEDGTARVAFERVL